ncbi:hypothetical protein KY912_000195 [Vibrio vulnificus]|nr:hypothetical protein [Vibrio vulnificus]
MRLLVKIIERKEVKAEIEKINTKLKDKEFAELFYKELEERRISKEDFKRHFNTNGWMLSISDDKYYSKLMIESGATKEFCDLQWLQHITNRIEYFQKNKIQQERKTNNILTQFIKN